MPSDPTDQTCVMEFLAARETHGGLPARRIDTSCASVFLAGDHAWKIKRAVDLGYLDFTTFESRLEACQAELALNRRTAPALYQRLAMVTWQADGSLALDGDGQAVEPVVIMRRFDDGALATDAVTRGEVDHAMIEGLGHLLAAYHRECTVLHPAADAETGRLEQCLAAAGLMTPQIPPARIEALARSLRQAWAVMAPALARRARAGWWRRGHGDLHLGNVCLLDGALIPFDALEFDDALASGDVLYDLAFLVMDLRRLGRDDLALALFDAYGDHGPEGPALMPGFIALRALIRAFVTHAGWRGSDRTTPPPIATIEAFLHEAERSLAPAPPRLIAIGGLSGTGKSTLARALAPLAGAAPGALHLRSDTIRKRLAGVAPTDRLPPQAYTPQATAQVYRTLLDDAAAALAAGRSVIADAVFSKPAERAAIEQAAGDHPFLGLWLDLPLARRQQRIEKRVGDASDATPAVAAAQEAYDLGDIGWPRLDADLGQAMVLAQARPWL